MLLDLSYLSYPLPPDIQRLYEAGDFARMERVIRLRLDDPRVPEALKARLRVQTELAYEILRAYPYTQAQMLEILQSHVKDFEEEELETLRDDGTLDWRYVNGEVRFKNNALSGLVYRPLCHCAGTPHRRQSVTNVMACTPQSPRSPLRKYSGMFVTVRYGGMKR